MPDPSKLDIDWRGLATATRVRRAELRLGQRDLAALLCVAPSTVSRLERYELHCDALTYVRLTAWLGQSFTQEATDAG